MSRLAESAAAAHVLVPDVEDERPELDEADAHHLVRVLRLRRGEHVTVGDGGGVWRRCAFTGDRRLDAVGPVEREPKIEPAITIGFSLVKGERPEWIVQKLTEMGVDRIVPVRARRSVVKWGAEQESKNLMRLRKVAREASMQSRRAWLPELADVVSVPDLGPVVTGPIALADPAGAPPSLERPAVIVGPEGGWDPEELDGAATVSLGPQILRAETAALVAGAVLCTLRAGLATSAESRMRK